MRVALDGDAALAEADAWGPEVVLLDIGLPGRDGYQVAEALRSRPALAGATLVAVTGYGLDNDRRRSAGSGFEVTIWSSPSISATSWPWSRGGRVREAETGAYTNPDSGLCAICFTKSENARQSGKWPG